MYLYIYNCYKLNRGYFDPGYIMCTLQLPIYIGRGRGGRQKCLNGRRGKVYIYTHIHPLGVRVGNE